jgi:hypothetical protein
MVGAERDLDGDSGPPHPFRVLPIVLIVPAVAWLAREFGGAIRVNWTKWTVFVVASAGLMGMPALFWALDTKRTRMWQLAILGATVAVLPMLAVLTSGVLGRLARGGWPYAWLMLEQGAIIPTYGILTWPMFVRIEVYAALIGATSATIYWVLFILLGGRRRRG